MEVIATNGEISVSVDLARTTQNVLGVIDQYNKTIKQLQTALDNVTREKLELEDKLASLEPKDKELGDK